MNPSHQRRPPLTRIINTSSFRYTMLVAGLAAACAPTSSSDWTGMGYDPQAVRAVMAVEDRRPTEIDSLAPIVAALDAQDAVARRVAVRALGRLERPTLVGRLTPFLTDASDTVRAEAAHAIAQSLFASDSDPILPVLRDRLSVETDPTVRGALALALGRGRYADSSALREVEGTLVRVSRDHAGADAPTETLSGVTRGLERLIRNHVPTWRPIERTVDRLRELARFGVGVGDVRSAHVRRASTAALAQAEAIPEPGLADLLNDPDPEVRRLAAGAVLPGHADGVRLRAWTDSLPSVRYETLRALTSTGPRTGCDLAREAARDPDPHLSLLGIDLLGTGCGDPTSLGPLTEIARADSGAARWNHAAHALVSLARVAPSRARPVLPRLLSHPNPFARRYGAAAAYHLGDAVALRHLAADSSDHVRQAAVRWLVTLEGHGADSVLRASLARSDYHLLLTTTQGLQGSPDREVAVTPLLDAFVRVSEERRETSRDIRVAMLERLEELGNAAWADRLRPFVEDFDPVVAARTAELLAAWTGASVRPTPDPLPHEPFPTVEELMELDRSRVVVFMEGGGEIEMRLFPTEAPTNAARFARLARQGYFDGLTFHRVVPNFVVQGGSPGANEYMGAGPYTRDEITARSHRRGTVGLSTRGRDTGDAQIFINLVDNVRLDFNYTIFGEVVRGMDVVDRLLEGARIVRVTVGDGG